MTKNTVNQSNLSKFEKEGLLKILENLSDEEKNILAQEIENSKILPPTDLEKLNEEAYQKEIARRLELNARCFGTDKLNSNLKEIKPPSKEEYENMLNNIIENDEKLLDLVTILGTQGLKTLTENLLTAFLDKKIEINVKDLARIIAALHNTRHMYSKEEELYYKKLEKLYIEENLNAL